MIMIVSYIIFCLTLAYINYRRIAYDKRINHSLNAVLHLGFWLTTYLITKNLILTLSLPFIGRVFFDTALNIMRGLPVDYVAKNPKSVIDKLEKKVFGIDGILPKIIYIAIAALLIIIYGIT